eukprot:356998-Chlamydomonas_euryale.AAC.5
MCRSDWPYTSCFRDPGVSPYRLEYTGRRPVSSSQNAECFRVVVKSLCAEFSPTSPQGFACIAMLKDFWKFEIEAGGC